MSNRTRLVRLSRAQASYVSASAFIPAEFRLALAAGGLETSSGRGAEFDVELVEAARESLTVRLAQVGLDSDYEATREGLLIEELIDALSTDDR